MTNKYKGIIYKRTCIVTNKSYIGQTVNEYLRNLNWNNLNHSYSGNKINSARKEYGVENFTYEVLFFTMSSDLGRLSYILNTMEKYYIKKFNTYNDGYNSTLGGGNCKDKAKRDDFYKIPVVQLDLDGNYVNEFDNIALAAKSMNSAGGKSSQTILNCCEGTSYISGGYQWMYSSDYYSPNLENKGKYNCPNNVSINQYDLSGNYITTYSSIKEASESLNVNYSAITHCCREWKNFKNVYSAYGFMWRYNTTNDKSNIDPYEKTDVQESTRIPVLKYSLEGKFLEEYPSITKASVETSSDTKGIIISCNALDSSIMCGGFLWRYKKDFDGIKEIPPKFLSTCKKVNQYDLDGNYIKTFDSVEKARSSIGISGSKGIQNSCNDFGNNISLNHSGGFLWRYVEDVGEGNTSSIPKYIKHYSELIPILKIDPKSGEVIKEYMSIQDADTDNGFYRGCLSRRLKLSNPTIYKNYIWKYKN